MKTIEKDKKVKLEPEETPMMEMVRMGKDKKVTKEELRRRFSCYFPSLEKLK